MNDLPFPNQQRKGLSLRFKLNVGIVLIISTILAGLNTFSVMVNRQARRTEARNTNETMARLIVGPLLGELVEHDVQSLHIHTFLNNMLTAALTLNPHNKELAFALVVHGENNELIAGRAKPELSVFGNGKIYPAQDKLLAAIAQLDGNIGPNIWVRRFPLKISGKGIVGKLIVGTSLARVEADARRDLVINLAAFSAALVALIAYSTAALKRMVISPLTQVVNAMRYVQRGNLQSEVTLNRNDEIGVLAETYNYMVRGLRERERLKDAFNRYVSPQVYEKFLAGEIALSGETRQATVLFSDIRGFTSLSERLTPTELVNMLNEYFNVMVEVVLRHEGFLNKFIGDALMAVYNAPLDQVSPELRAVKTAVEMVEKLAVLNQSREQRGQGALQIGIGINTGPVVAGNIGHERRLEYTVIGDAVNLAQRIESQTKEAGVMILISETTYQAVADQIIAERLPPVKVKGKAEAIAIYAVTGIKDDFGFPVVRSDSGLG